ncbi:hypothetical protein DOY81_003681 [Sarcophaga bullata]|nr:hypothetical protein DOY81_003681 [Sarcophaga bullata]
MDISGVKECFINGVTYKCRTCFDPGATVCSLNEEFKNAKTWRDLLKDVGQLKTTHDDLLPTTICCVCSEKLKSSYDFLRQIHSVNRKFLKLLGKSEDPLQDSFQSDVEQYSDCLEESTIDLPLEQYIPEIKLEDDLESTHTKLEEEGNQTYFSEKEVIKSDTEHSDDNKKYKTRSSKAQSNSNDDDSEENTSSDESDCRQRKRLKKENSGIKSKNCANRKGRKAPDYYDKIEKVGDRFVCLLCQKSFSLRKDCGRHIVSIHVRPILYSCEFCGQGFSRKDKIQQHIKRMHSDIPSDYLDDNSNDNIYGNEENSSSDESDYRSTKRLKKDSNRIINRKYAKYVQISFRINRD